MRYMDVGFHWYLLPIITNTYIDLKKTKSVKIKTVNPATEEILAEYDALTPVQVNHEVNDARKVYESIWKNLIFLREQSFSEL